jgi:hypothetical protein
LKVDSSGNNYLAGTFDSASFAAGNLSLTRQSEHGSDCFLIKTDAGGNVIWARQGRDAAATALALDGQTNCYLAGTASGSSVFDGLTPTNPTTGQFFVKYNTAGTPLWARGDMRTGNQLLVDSGQNIVSAGSFSGTESAATIFVAKYDRDGNFLWGRQLRGRGHDEVTGMFTDWRTNYWLTGTFAGSDDLGQPVAPKMFLACLDSDGQLLGLAEDPGNGVSTGTGLAVYPGIGPFLCGTFSTQTVVGAHCLTNAGDADVVLVRLGGLPPIIKATASGTNLIQSWPDPRLLGFTANETFVLETSANLTSWSPSPVSPVLISGQYVVTNSMADKVKYYRLRK